MFDQKLFYRLPLQSPLRTHGSLTRVRDAGQFLRLGARGEGVALVQQALIGVAAGMPASTRGGRCIPDGIFGSETLVVLQGFQASAGLATDGIFGPKTLTALDATATRTGLASFVTLGQALLERMRIVRALPISAGGGIGPLATELQRLDDLLKPFNLRVWTDSRLEQLLLQTSPRLGTPRSQSQTVFTSTITLPPPAHPALLALWVVGNLVIIAVGSTVEPPPLPKLPSLPKVPPVVGGIAGIALVILHGQLKTEAKKAFELIEAWTGLIALNLNSGDPKCKSAAKEAQEAVKELKLVAFSVLNVHLPSRRKPGPGGHVSKIIGRLLRAVEKARKAVFKMLQKCALPPG